MSRGRVSDNVRYPFARAFMRNVRPLVRINRKSEAPTPPAQGLTPARAARNQVAFTLHPYYPVEDRLGAKLTGFPLSARYGRPGMETMPQFNNLPRDLPVSYADYLDSIGGSSQ